MNDREKVIEGFEKLRKYADNEVHPVVSPDNWNIYSELRDLIDKAEKDTLALLKAQTPKVLALDEIHRGMAVWLEDVDKADVILAIGGSSAGGAKCFITENDMSIAPLSAEYGIRWRAWTAEPTEEQRKGVKWGA